MQGGDAQATAAGGAGGCVGGDVAKTSGEHHCTVTKGKNARAPIILEGSLASELGKEKYLTPTHLGTQPLQ